MQVESITMLVAWMGFGVSLFVAGLWVLRGVRRGMTGVAGVGGVAAATAARPALEVATLVPASEPALATGDPLVG